MIPMLVALLAIQAAVAPPVIVTPVIQADPFARMSTAGRAVVDEQMKLEPGRRQAMQAEIAAAEKAVRDQLARSPLDPNALRAALVARDEVQAKQRRERTEQAIALIRRLSPVDQAIVANALLAPVPARR